jgi:hypothetical protein
MGVDNQHATRELSPWNESSGSRQSAAQPRARTLARSTAKA